MNGKFIAPTACPRCGGMMQAGAIKTTRENYMIPDRYPFERLTSGELWYALEQNPDGRFVMLNKDGPLMVLHYRCVDCGYLESYAQGKYPA